MAASGSVRNLAAVWGSLEELCSGLDDKEWRQPTGCPGWSVQDNLAHLVDYEARALGRQEPDGPTPDGTHLRNDLGRANEVGVARRRALPGAEVLAEFHAVTRERLAGLEQLGEEDLRAEAMTPAGPGTVADLLRLRVMDSWSHEQDIRRALHRPGHLSGPVVDEAMGYFTQFLPFVVGKRAGAPEGTTVTFAVEGRPPTGVEVVGGRGRPAAPADAPTVVVRMPLATFVALVNGRSDAPDDVTLEGDEALGRRVVAALGFMP